MRREQRDVLIVGAGLSGVGAACHLKRECPDKSYLVLEAREAIGGTWDLFRYPGIRSDSDMFTLGYSFRPWRHAKAIADGPAILDYIRETAREYGVVEHIRFGHRVTSASWSSADSCWTVVAEALESGECLEVTCRFLFMCSGYYRYDEGFTPPLPDLDRFRGPVVHPQHWPPELDVARQRVVVIGSGATAVTLVPALARAGARVTMLQRSPTYIVSRPGTDPVVERVRRWLGGRLAYRIARRRNIALTSLSYRLSRTRPEVLKRAIRRGVEQQLPPGYDVEKHFTPRYDPWDQRLCLAPDGDFFDAIRSGGAEIVTDHIRRFTQTGIELESGQALEADIVITATGLNLQLFGEVSFRVDGEPVDFAQRVAYRGMMFSGVPNLALAVGYTNASWTLKCDLVSEYVCRLLQHMDARGYTRATPLPPPPGTQLVPLMGLNSGYILRARDRMPKQAVRAPWQLHQNYAKDVKLFRRSPLEDEGMQFSREGEDAPSGGYESSMAREPVPLRGTVR